jgi:hypothetical protein
VEGHVEAQTEQMAHDALSEAGYVTERLWPDPKPLNQGPTAQAPQFSDALDSALDTSSTQVAFDDLTERYKGKRVWVIDRDKIRRRAAQVVDQAIAMSHHEQENAMELRERVADAIKGMFGDNRNIASERPAENPAAAPAGNAEASTALDQQIQRLNHVVTQAESVLATLAAAARRLGSGGGGGPRRRFVPQPVNEPQNEVLLEIFKTNLELRSAIEGGNGTSPKPAAAGATAPAAPPAPPTPPTPQPRTPASAATP